jgi:hypothetical protein
MRSMLLSLSLAVAGLLSSCASSGSCCSAECNAQAVVDTVAKTNPEVVRLTVHCTQKDGSMMACASTSADKKGKPSDPEDKEAISTGAPVVKDEAGNTDVTLPIMVKDGKCTVACGVTLRAGMSQDQAVAKAVKVAREIEAGIGNCPCCQGK